MTDRQTALARHIGQAHAAIEIRAQDFFGPSPLRRNETDGRGGADLPDSGVVLEQMRIGDQL